MLNLETIARITGGKILQQRNNFSIEHLLLDSRKIIQPAASVFIAIRGPRHDAHKFLNEVYNSGVRNFIIEEQLPYIDLPEANIILVNSSTHSLQQIAAWHRSMFNIPVIGITGSNGKTIIKEWLSQMLSKDYIIVRNPKSYNSQVGVPLSVWQINEQHTLGIFEAGISQPDEMLNLQKIIQPTMGLFTNIGPAHDEGFDSREQKIKEKLLLFKSAEILFYSREHEEIHNQVIRVLPDTRKFTWGINKDADFIIKEQAINAGRTRIQGIYKGQTVTFLLPFSDQASVENLLHCITILLYMNVDAGEIQIRLQALQRVAMRLELKEGINSCQLIDDTYNNDLAGLTIAINFLEQQTRREYKTIILSDLLESGMEESSLYRHIAELLNKKEIHKLIGVGPVISRNSKYFKMNAQFYPDTNTFLEQLDPDYYSDELILVKGARIFEFEKIVHRLQQKVHGTVLEINLDALSDNLNFFRSKLKPQTKIMVMVKAFAYGSGSFEVANLLQFHRVDYLAVAYADEGVALRENGISVPVMVMNPSAETFDKLFQYNLEPEIYSFKILNEYLEHLKKYSISSRIHLKLDTGMRRLGFEENDLKELVKILKENPLLQLTSVFTHMAAADEEKHNPFSYGQIALFTKMCDYIKDKTGAKFLRHAMNSAGIVRFPEAQFDMVRLGIGLYGVEANNREQNRIRAVGTLKTVISQIKLVKQGETVGYSRRGVAELDMKIATIAIGYADGYDRRFSRGVGKVLIAGKLCPIIGNVCMDMCMVDVTGTQAQEGDEVIVFGKDLSIIQLAESIGTIPYEILTGVSERVKRVFYTE